MSPAGKQARFDADGLRGLTWEELLDGRLRVLTRGVHYSGSTKVLEQRARGAARVRGRVAATSADRFGRREALWVQFLDGQVQPGRPCPACGEPALERLQVYFAGCPACGAVHRLSVTAPGAQDAAVAKAIERGKYRLEYDERYLLTDYRHAHFFTRSQDYDYEVLYGRAVDPLGVPVLVWARYPLSRAARIRTATDREHLWRIARWPVPAFRSFVNLSRLPADPGAAAGLAHPDRLGGHLSEYSEARFLHAESLPARERFFGHARDAGGSRVLLYVDFPLIAGARVTDQDNPGTDFHVVYEWPSRPFGSAIDLTAVSRDQPPGPAGRESPITLA